MNAQSNRKGIVLAGGTGTRLYPTTKGISKQLIPVFDKPMIYYPISTLMLAGIREILVISTPHDLPMFERLLGDGSTWGLSFSYAVQEAPKGLAQAFTIAEEFLAGSPSCLVLGDNIFFGNGLTDLLLKSSRSSHATVFGYSVTDPERYGVAEFNADGKVVGIQEKPKHPKSNYAVVGLYFFDEKAPEYAKQVKPSARGELEITDLIAAYLREDNLQIELLGRGFAWLDTGTNESLSEANLFVKSIESRQGLKIGCLEEVAWHNGWISSEKLREIAVEYGEKNPYGKYLNKLSKIGGRTVWPAE